METCQDALCRFKKKKADMLRVVSDAQNDIYTVEDGTPHTLKPVVFFVHGGAWHVGSKERTRPVCEALAQLGYVAVSTSYCLSSLSDEQLGTALTSFAILLLAAALTCPTVSQMMVATTLALLIVTFCAILWLFLPREEVKHPAHIQEVARHFRWVVDHVAEYGGDPDRIILMGHSAGGHLASLLATNGAYLQQVGVDPGAVKACVSLSGPYSDKRLAETQLGQQIMSNVFGRRPHYYDAFPLYHATRNTCPFLLLNAGLDISMKRHALDFHYVLRHAGVYVKTVYFDDETHWSLVQHWTSTNRVVLDEIHAFIQERLDMLADTTASVR